eukprot:TRINITY_DN1069_c0_g1_i1.p2 TRINITY_DN1069_c0_g1~~TRINITY_DN1069_c0_g1_i1.p2  ORF type:complete len:129 (+),score=49.55 TRINITY_DN1069_c0_g1_i1:143-529(+)
MCIRDRYQRRVRGQFSIAMASLGKSLLNKAADMYWKSVSKQLNRYGLRYEDVLVETPELYEALRRMNPEAREGRTMRYRRAVDLSFKKHYLPEEVQAKLAPNTRYLNIAQVEKEYAERIHWDRINRVI